MRKKYSAKEKALVLSKETLLIKDICVLYECGYRRARKIADLYFEKVDHNKALNGVIVTSKFIELFNYDEPRILQYAKIGI